MDTVAVLYEKFIGEEEWQGGVKVTKVKLTVVESKCRCGYCKKGDEGRVIIRGERINYEVIEIKDRLDNENIQSILATCMYMPNEEKIARAIKEYASNDSIRVFGCSKNRVICGIIVLDVSGKEYAIIKAIAVEERYRKQGIGKVMIHHLINKALVKIIVAETDDDAVGFYRNAGFVIEDLGEKYEGIKRYKCTLDCTQGVVRLLV